MSSAGPGGCGGLDLTLLTIVYGDPTERKEGSRCMKRRLISRILFNNTRNLPVFPTKKNAELSMKQWEIFKFFCSLIKAKKFLRQIPGRSTQIAVTSCLERGEAEDRARSVASFGTLYTFTCYVVHLSSHPRRKPSKLASNFVALV